LFVVNIPAGFTRQLLRHERPSLLIEADATDPTATASALAAVNGIVQSVIQRELIPYIGIGLIQASIILLAARFIFQVPFFGNIGAVYLSALLFIAANLTVGITFSSLAQNQLQAVQLAIFYFLPNILLSGFMFPFKGMPAWAQVIGNLLPLTYFNRLIRGILLKGNGWSDSWPSVWPMMVFTLALMGVAVATYRRTLD
jgi:ABC-2 type transport system permease protein